MSDVHAVFCFNDRYVYLAAAALASLFSHAGGGRCYKIYLVCRELNAEHRYRLQKLAREVQQGARLQLHFIDFDVERFFARKLPTIMYFSLDVYTRLALPWILPDLKRVVYLDADVLVNTDIAELYDLDLGAHPLAAVGGAAAGAVRYGTGDIIEQLRQGGQPIAKLAGFERYHNYYEYYTQYLHLAPEHLGSTFCSAVMLLDLQRCREPLERQLPQLLGRRFVLPDQDILNIIFQGQAHLLGYEWQTLPDHVLSHVQREGQLPKLIHFVGPKPDVYWGMTPAHVEFWRQLSSTDFFYPALNRFADLRARQLRRDQQRSAQEVQQLRTELKQLRAELAQLRQRPPQARDSVWRS